MAPALSIEDLRKTYGSTVAVDSLSFTVPEGEIFGLIGPNGAGKTTIAECVLGLQSPDSGRIRVLGMDPQTASPSFYQRIGAQLQNAALPDRITVREALTLFSSFYSTSANPDELLKEWQLEDKRETKFSALSGGEKQRLFIALALLHHPDLVILDEISTGLDPEAREMIRTRLKELRATGTTILLITHFMDEAEALCDRVALLEAGHCLALDTPSQLIDKLDASYKVEFTVPATVQLETLRRTTGVHSVHRSDGQVTVRGRENLLRAVVEQLAAQDIIPDHLHAERATLEDVFMALTRRSVNASRSSPTLPARGTPDGENGRSVAKTGRFCALT